MADRPFRRHPSVVSTTEEAFIAGAETHRVPASATLYPWDSARQDVLKQYQLRLPEPYLEKLRYIGQHTPFSMQQFCLEVLLPAIDAKIAELIATG